MTGEIITQLIGVVIIYAWVFGLIHLLEKTFRITEKKESDDDTRAVLTPNAAFTFIIIEILGVTKIKSLFNITFDFLNVTLTVQILWGIVAVCFTTHILTKNKKLEDTLETIIILAGLAILILP